MAKRIAANESVRSAIPKEPTCRINVLLVQRLNKGSINGSGVAPNVSGVMTSSLLFPC
jgi:hypothetical protein